ncbi:MAG: 50S ribosomal protein L3 [Chlamydiae bacterium]|nr:50S ribosomal protein L3 [Chlamydiota bacterium]
MSLTLVGKKQGMMRFFNKKGNVVVCSVIAWDPNVISQIKSLEKDGYQAIQLAAFKLSGAKAKNLSKPLKGHFAKAGIEPRGLLKESRIKEGKEYAAQQEIGFGFFFDATHVDVTAISKGKGYQGVMKRHNFAGGPAAHGSGFHRHGGSCGMRTSPGRCLPGQKKAGRMGAEQVTVENLEIVKIDDKKNLLLVKGAIPGARGGVVYIRKSRKRKKS